MSWRSNSSNTSAVADCCQATYEHAINSTETAAISLPNNNPDDAPLRWKKRRTIPMPRSTTSAMQTVNAIKTETDINAISKLNWATANTFRMATSAGKAITKSGQNDETNTRAYA